MSYRNCAFGHRRGLGAFHNFTMAHHSVDVATRDACAHAIKAATRYGNIVSLFYTALVRRQHYRTVLYITTALAIYPRPALSRDYSSRLEALCSQNPPFPSNFWERENVSPLSHLCIVFSCRLGQIYKSEYPSPKTSLKNACIPPYQRETYCIPPYHYVTCVPAPICTPQR